MSIQNTGKSATYQLPQSSLTRYVRRQIAVSAVVDPVKSAESGSAQSADIFNRVIIRVPPSSSRQAAGMKADG